MMKHAPHRRHPKMPAPGIPSKELLQLLHKEYENCGNPLDRLRDGKVRFFWFLRMTSSKKSMCNTTWVYGFFFHQAVPHKRPSLGLRHNLRWWHAV
jgi:hypothetical protein